MVVVKEEKKGFVLDLLIFITKPPSSQPPPVCGGHGGRSFTTLQAAHCWRDDIFANSAIFNIVKRIRHRRSSDGAHAMDPSILSLIRIFFFGSSRAKPIISCRHAPGEPKKGKMKGETSHQNFPPTTANQIKASYIGVLYKSPKATCSDVPILMST